MLKLTCGMPQPPTLKIFMPSVSLLFSLQVIIMLHLGHSKTQHRLLEAFRGGCRGSQRAALHLLSNVPLAFPAMEADEMSQYPTGLQRSRRAAATSLSMSLQKEFSHKSQMAAGAYAAAQRGNGERQIHTRFVGLTASLQH